jgi:hypothetical protein
MRPLFRPAIPNLLPFGTDHGVVATSETFRDTKGYLWRITGPTMETVRPLYSESGITMVPYILPAWRLLVKEAFWDPYIMPVEDSVILTFPMPLFVRGARITSYPNRRSSAFYVEGLDRNTSSSGEWRLLGTINGYFGNQADFALPAVYSAIRLRSTGSPLAGTDSGARMQLAEINSIF